MAKPKTNSAGNTTTAVVLPADLHELVRKAALVRVMRGERDRVSASDVIREALTAYAPKLRFELHAWEVTGPEGRV